MKTLLSKHLQSICRSKCACHLLNAIRGCFRTCPCCNALTPTQHESGTAVSVHAAPVYTQRYAQILNFYNFETVFSLSKCESLFDSTLQTGTYDYIASSHQVKSKSDSQHCQFISVSKLCLLHSFEWPLHAATTVGIQISVVHAMHHGQVPIHPLVIQLLYSP